MKWTSLLLLAALFTQVAFAGPEDAKVISGVQAKLGVPVDGKMGARTEAALKEFQRAKGLAPSGELDKRTLTALGLGGPKPAPLVTSRMPGDQLSCSSAKRSPAGGVPPWSDEMPSALS